MANTNLKSKRVNIKDILVIAPHFKRRLSGITSTVVQLIPKQRELGCKIAVFGPGLPADLGRMRWWQLPFLWKKTQNNRKRVWHARRNIEMLGGVILRDLLRMPLKLLFTSAAQRKHSKYTKWLIHKMDKVVATSKRSGSYLDVEHRVIMHGIDNQAFRPLEAESEKKIPKTIPGKYLIACSGRVRHQKGTDLFIESMIKLLPAYPDWSAIITGRITKEHRAFADKLQEKIKRSGLDKRIHFLGEVDDIKPWYQKLTLFVAPSRNEGFGLTPLEAMASGAAVVASDAGAYSEMIKQDQTGAIVPAGELDALVNAIKKYLESPLLAKQHGKEAIKHVAQNFPLEKEAKKLIQIYDELTGYKPNG